MATVIPTQGQQHWSFVEHPGRSRLPCQPANGKHDVKGWQQTRETPCAWNESNPPHETLPRNFVSERVMR